MKKRRLSLSFMSFALLATLLNDPIHVFANPVITGNWMDEAATSYQGGTGSSENPYQIVNAQQLALLAKDANNALEIGKYYKLQADIDLKGKVWTPIGKDQDGFYQATLDGDHHVIKGMVVRENGMAGLIAYNQASSIKNIGLQDVDVEGTDEVGALIGYAKDSGVVNNDIENCYASGKVKGTNKVGGLIGNAQYDISQTTTSAIHNSFAIVDVQGNAHIGGFAGFLQNVEDVENCFASGDVLASEGNAGGFVGDMQAVKVQNAYARGNVKGTIAGGFAGKSEMGSIANIYAVGEVTGTIGAGITGENDASLKTTYATSYFSKDRTKQSVGIANETNTNVVGLLEKDMLAEAGKTNMLFTSFDTNWVSIETTSGNAYFPQLKVFMESDERIKELVLNKTATTAYYKVTFDIKDGVQQDNTPLTQYVKYLNVAQAPNITKKGHTLVWDKNLTIIGDTVISAIFTPIAITGIQIHGPSFMYTGLKSTLQANIQPADALEVPLTWKVIEGQDYLRVDQDGTIEALKAGKAKVEVSLSDDDSIKSIHEIIVKDGDVESIEKDILALPDNITYAQKEEVLLIAKAYRALSEEQRALFSAESVANLQLALEEISNVMKHKTEIQVTGNLDLGVEVFLSIMPKTRSAWVDITEKTDKHVFQMMQIDLYDHFKEDNIQPKDEITITLQTAHDFIKEKNVQIAVVQEDDTLTYITPSSIAENSLTFASSQVGTMAIIADAPEDIEEQLKEETKKEIAIVNTSDASMTTFFQCTMLFAISTIGFLAWKRKQDEKA